VVRNEEGGVVGHGRDYEGNHLPGNPSCIVLVSMQGDKGAKLRHHPVTSFGYSSEKRGVFGEGQCTELFAITKRKREKRGEKRILHIELRVRTKKRWGKEKGGRKTIGSQKSAGCHNEKGGVRREKNDNLGERALLVSGRK